MQISPSMACCHGHATMRAENAAGYETEGEEEGDYTEKKRHHQAKRTILTVKVEDAIVAYGFPVLLSMVALLSCSSFLDLMAPMVLLGMFQRMSRAFCFCFLHCTISHPLF